MPLLTLKNIPPQGHYDGTLISVIAYYSDGSEIAFSPEKLSEAISDQDTVSTQPTTAH